MKLTEEDKENIREMIEDNKWPSVIKIASLAVENQLVKIKNISLSEGPQEIFSRKAQYDGAKAVELMFVSMSNQLRKQRKQDE